MTLIVPRLAVALFGNTETALRLPGFLCALGSLVLIFLIAHRIAGRTAAVLAMFFLAFQPEYIHYDTIFKQYPYEVFFSLALLYGAERVIARGNLRDRLLFAATSVGGVLFATPLVHLYPAVFCVLLWNEWKRSKRFPAYSFGVACAALAVSIADYWIFLKPDNMSGLANYWEASLVSGGSVVAAQLRLADLTFEMFRQFLYHPSGALGGLFYKPIAALFLILAVVGCVRLLKERRPRFVVYTVAPLLILAAYSLIKLWPFGANRVNLFYFPLLMIAAAVGASFLWGRLRAVRGAGRVAAALLAAAFLVPYLPVRRAREFYYGVDQLRTPLSRFLPQYRPGDVVLTRDTTHQIFLYYSRHYAPFRKFRRDMEVFIVYHPWVINLKRRHVPQDEIYAEVERHFRDAPTGLDHLQMGPPGPAGRIGHLESRAPLRKTAMGESAGLLQGPFISAQEGSRLRGPRHAFRA